MIGRVESLHALIGVPLFVGLDRCVEIEFVVDTGFTVFLALPPQTVAALALPFLHKVEAELADGTVTRIPIHVGRIEWNGIERRVRVLATGNRPLVGTGLLADCNLGVEFVEGGLVAVDRRR